MKFLYRYQRGASVEDGEISAPSMDAAYSLLRKSGVRPMKVWAKPGLLNRLSAIGKRGFAILMLAALLVALLAVFHFRMPEIVGPEAQAPAAVVPLVKTGPRPLTRRQLPPFEVRFDTDAENVLACFARPGDLSALGDPDSMVERFASDLSEALEREVEIAPGDVLEVETLKRIVIGLKEEARIAVSAGESAADIFLRLYERQKMEAAYRAAAVSTLRQSRGGEGFDRLLLDTNESLRSMGLKEISENSIFPY